MWGRNRTMVIRLFLSLLALLSGLSAAHAANPARSVQSAIGASANLASVVVAQEVGSQRSIGMHWYVDQPRSVLRDTNAYQASDLPAPIIAPRTYLSDRTRQ
jgi:hypothetical protein